MSGFRATKVISDKGLTATVDCTREVNQRIAELEQQLAVKDAAKGLMEGALSRLEQQLADRQSRIAELEKGIKVNIKSYEQSGYVAQSVKALKDLIK